MDARPSPRVVVFESANPEFFPAHFDLTGKIGNITTAVGPSSIAKIRGCVRGVSSEFVLACDMHFASRENRYKNLHRANAYNSVASSAELRAPRIASSYYSPSCRTVRTSCPHPASASQSRDINIPLAISGIALLLPITNGFLGIFAVGDGS